MRSLLSVDVMDGKAKGKSKGNPEWVLVYDSCNPPSPTLIPWQTSKPEYSLPNDDGVLPCGIADIANWGLNMVYDLTVHEEYAACLPYMPDVTVLCLDTEGNWSDTHISNMRPAADGKTVHVDISQHGLCGIFPVPTP